MDTFNWYSTLIKPSWAPPASVFGPVWTVLYIGIFISFGAVFVLLAEKKIGLAIALPFILNLIFNFSFSPIQFTLRNNYLASVDIIFILVTLIWGMIAIYNTKTWITYAQIPYLL